jgi:hypothetical protein
VSVTWAGKGVAPLDRSDVTFLFPDRPPVKESMERVFCRSGFPKKGLNDISVSWGRRSGQDGQRLLA